MTPDLTAAGVRCNQCVRPVRPKPCNGARRLNGKDRFNCLVRTPLHGRRRTRSASPGWEPPQQPVLELGVATRPLPWPGAQHTGPLTTANVLRSRMRRNACPERSRRVSRLAAGGVAAGWATAPPTITRRGPSTRPAQRRTPPMTTNHATNPPQARSAHLAFRRAGWDERRLVIFPSGCVSCATSSKSWGLPAARLTAMRS